jgi:hypothetical protein
MMICKDSPERGEHTMNFGLNDRAALVPGTSKGIGTTTAHSLAAEGARVAGWRTMTRRRCILLVLAALPRPIRAEMKLGDEDWMRCLHSFITIFNVFLSALDDGRFDHSAFLRAQAAWKRLEVK